MITKTCKTTKHLPGLAARQLSPVVLASGKRCSISKITKEIINLVYKTIRINCMQVGEVKIPQHLEKS